MLKICNNIDALDFRQLMDVYEETNCLTGKKLYPNKTENIQVIFAEQDFYQYLRDFFSVPNALYALWAEGGAYKAALRLEEYNNGGWLIAALEVAPTARKQGYATNLLNAVKEYAARNALLPLYSHVDKKNLASMATHIKCGFTVIAENAVFLDGTFHNDHATLSWK